MINTKLLAKLTSFVSSHFVLILFLVVVISYGQMLKMYVYQDDNAIFFKLAHLEGNAGFLGPGPFGEGPYKYSATPYIPIYYFFGYNTVAYYSLAFVLYFLAAVFVYKVFSEIIGKTSGKITGFLFAAGYIASDGFIRLYNSVTTSFTIILASLLLFLYWKFYKTNNYKWYLLSLPIFLAAIEFGQSRTHYLVGVVILFELVFLAFNKPIKSFFPSFLRLTPFLLIFYRYFLQNADSRSGQIAQLLIAFSKGEFFQSFGIVTTLTNLVIPDWLTSSSILHAPLVFIASLFWRAGARKIFTNPMLEVGDQSKILLFLGCILIAVIAALAILIKDSQKKKIFIFLSFWMMINIAAYSAYMPLVTYESIHRYIAHSFLPLVGILGLLATLFQGKKLRIFLLSVVVLWGIGNLSAAYAMQNNIIENRSIPSRSFYQQLRNYVPQIKKGDILYFDVAENASQRFADAIIVSQMPDTASLAWKYGIDRYDFKRFLDFASLAKEIKDVHSDGNNVYTFFYDGDLLVNTTEQFRQQLAGSSNFQEVTASLPSKSETSVQNTAEGTLLTQTEATIQFQKSLSGIFPSELEVDISATPLDYGKVSCPCFSSLDDLVKKTTSGINISNVFDYQQHKNEFFKTSKITVSNQWQDRVVENLFDNDNSTVWQADRILWHSKETAISIDLGQQEEVDRLVWVNGFANNTPTNYSILVSKDGDNWNTVKRVDKVQKIDGGQLEVVDFPITQARFVKMVITGTISKDSPAVAEVWVVPAKFSDLDITKAETIIGKPLAYLQDGKTSYDILRDLNYQGKLKIYWKSNKYESWKSSEKSYLVVNYDGVSHQYKFSLPAGGTEISALKLVPVTIPGELKVNKISARYISLDELSK